MSKRKRKHLSRAHRAAIARGLRRYWLRVRGKRARARIKARTRRELAKIQKQEARAKQLKKRGIIRGVARKDEWEVTVRYEPKRRGQAIGITLRILAPVNTPQDVIRLVAKRAGMGQLEKGFEIHGVNWQKPLGGTREKSYDYDDWETGLQVPGFTGLFGAGTVRAEKVKGD